MAMKYHELPRGEEDSVEFLQERGLLPNERRCSRGHLMKLYFGSRIDWACKRAECRTKVGMRVGNWFEDSRLPFETIIRFIYAWAEEWSSIKFCAKQLEMSDNSTIDYSKCMREICSWRLQQKHRMIGGEQLTVEVDESLFTKRKNHSGRLLPQQWMLGGICRETKEVFLVQVPDRSAATLLPIIAQYVHPASTIITDSWRSYNGLQNAGFTHQSVNHRYNFVDPDTGAHTQNAERMWRTVKWRNKKQSGTKREALESYMEEFMWRRQLGEEEAFDRILEDIAAFRPPAVDML